MEHSNPEPQPSGQPQPYKKPFWWRRDVRVALGVVLVIILMFILQGIFGGAEQEAQESAAALTASYEQVQEGMSINQVEAIMGPGTEVTATNIAGVETTVLKWEDGFYNSAQMTFINGALNSKILIN